MTGSYHPAATQSPHEAIYYYGFTHLQAVRSGNWKLVRQRPAHPPWVGWSGRFVGNAVEEDSLYDLATDTSARFLDSAPVPARNAGKSTPKKR